MVKKQDKLWRFYGWCEVNGEILKEREEDEKRRNKK